MLLLASLPRKGIDKEAGRSARTPAPEVALLLPAQAQSGAPLRAPLPVCSGLASACILQRGRPLTPKPPLPVLMLRMPREEGAQGKRAFSPRKRGRLAALRGRRMHKIYHIGIVGIYHGEEKPSLA